MQAKSNICGGLLGFGKNSETEETRGIFVERI
jgi:hypothetical protein